MEQVDISVENVRRLKELVEKYNLAELTVEENGLCITIKGRLAADGVGDGAGASCMLPHSVLAGPHPQGVEIVMPTPADLPASKEEILRHIMAPMVGVFYRASSPEALSYIEVGDSIEEGQTIGVIEAMKVFSEIPSEISGEVVEIPARNGKLVHQGDTLVVVRVSEE